MTLGYETHAVVSLLNLLGEIIGFLFQSYRRGFNLTYAVVCGKPGCSVFGNRYVVNNVIRQPPLTEPIGKKIILDLDCAFGGAKPYYPIRCAGSTGELIIG